MRTQYDSIPRHAQWFYLKRRILRPGEKRDKTAWAKKQVMFLIACGWL